MSPLDLSIAAWLFLLLKCVDQLLELCFQSSTTQRCAPATLTLCTCVVFHENTHNEIPVRRLLTTATLSRLMHACPSFGEDLTGASFSQLDFLNLVISVCSPANIFRARFSLMDSLHCWILLVFSLASRKNRRAHLQNGYIGPFHSFL